MSESLSALRIQHAGDFTVKAGWMLPTRQLDDYELVYFPDGGETIYFRGNEEFVMQEPCFLIIRPGEVHRIQFDRLTAIRHLFVHFRWSGVQEDDDLRHIFHPDSPPVILSHSKFDTQTGSLFKKLLYLLYNRPVQWEFRSRLLLCEILYDLNEYAHGSSMPAEAGQALPAPVHFVLERMERHLGEELHIADLARSVGWSHEHLTRTFIRYLGRSPREMLKYKRIERAAQLIVSEMRSIKDIAYRVGFKDEHYFSRAFSKAKGLAPTEYRSRFFNPIVSHLVPVDAMDSMYPQNKYLVMNEYETDQMNP